MSEWFEDETFWITYAPLMFDEVRWAEVKTSVDNILKLAPIGPGAPVLDICCGVGRHTSEFARRGFAVTGVDITQAYLDAAKETAAGAPIQPEFIHQDIRHFLRPKSFKLCLNLFASFGYFGNPRDDLLVLKNCARNLSPGGWFILETLGKEVEARDFLVTEEFERGGWQVRTEYEVVDDWEGVRNRWILRDGDKVVDRSFVLRLYSALEMKTALREAGFTQIDIFGGLDGRPYDQNALSLVARAAVK
ncbi:Methyltransferase type 11 [uncultured Spirochaetota bacterium]|jgi:SAM-dependent methyltransferase|uniref:Methyltransferase type 11 n=1 Tax=uncultured Spirochaetota bacterium TaxID=460511 RepID=A0A652ZVN8_9SPIR|nr:Methyltransferase type 11 [uncultured Spirochaetota bacterium]